MQKPAVKPRPDEFGGLPGLPAAAREWQDDASPPALFLVLPAAPA